jgi:hypothetical protein
MFKQIMCLKALKLNNSYPYSAIKTIALRLRILKERSQV